jgi:adenine deaminase
VTPLDFPRRDVLKAAALAPALAVGARFTATAVPAAPAMPAQRGADLVLRSGKIITVDREFTLTAAIAIAGERILAVGGDAEIAAHVAPWIRVIDLAGRAVIPGLIDGHAHLDREGLKGIFARIHCFVSTYVYKPW